ncbi:MAG: tetratricopeptide repeat protein [Verrucomicrobiales bacterium]|nr:tetratricopeptide repeat protein [Verrucomicrobiales bacterium]
MKTCSPSGSAGSRLRRAASLSLAILMGGSCAWTAPFVPDNDTQVLERVRIPSSAFGLRELRGLQTKVARDSKNLTLALELANQCVARARAEADPRYLGYAEAALSHWFGLVQPPASVLVVRATIRQSNHDFVRAMADLDLALQLDPNNAQAWVTRASILLAQGRYAEAKRAFLSLARLTSELVSVTCASSVASLTGEAGKSYDVLNRALARAGSSSREEKLWATTSLAEIAARLGRAAEAEEHFRAALAIDPNDAYLLGAFADFLLDEARPVEVLELLGTKMGIDALLLRAALAEQMCGREAEAKAHIVTLHERFAATRMRADNVHQREEARFMLHLLKLPDEAVRLALANWQVQREPADLRILCEAALATGHPQAIEVASAWLRRTGLEDARLTGWRAAVVARLPAPRP